MSPRRIASLGELGDAWAAEHDAHVAGGKAAHAGKAYVDDWRARYGTAPRGDPMKPAPAMLPYGDRPVCACGKVSYPSRDEARRAAPYMTPYACPLGHPIFHLHGRGRSRRERGLGS